jgi:large subunit ribosomal protein L5
MLDSEQVQEPAGEQEETSQENTSGEETVDQVKVSNSEATQDGQSEEAPKPAPRRQRAAAGTRPARSRRAAAAEEEPAEEGDSNVPAPRLREMYRNEIIPNMMREFGFENPMEVPRVQKIVLNIGLGEALTNGRAMESAVGDLSAITGQKPVVTRARKSIAGFKVREGNPIGTSVTLRGGRMYHFLDRFINTALPRIRDFRGLPRRGFDGRGNFSIGIREQIIFPEIDYNQIDRLRGLQVTITTSARNDSEAVRLLELYGMPFVKET